VKATRIHKISEVVIRQIYKELKSLAVSPLEGISVVPNERDISEIHAVITGPVDTPFEGGEFKVKLKIGAEFPQAPPKGFFLTKIFHPNVSEKGEICVNTLKRDWKETLGFKDILLTIKCLLIVPNPESALNEEAGRLLLEKYDDYFQRAKIFTSIHARPAPPLIPEPADPTPEESDIGGEKENQTNNTAPPPNTVNSLKPHKTPAAAPPPSKLSTNAKKRELKRL